MGVSILGVWLSGHLGALGGCCYPQGHLVHICPPGGSQHPRGKGACMFIWPSGHCDGITGLPIKHVGLRSVSGTFGGPPLPSQGFSLTLFSIETIYSAMGIIILVFFSNAFIILCHVCVTTTTPPVAVVSSASTPTLNVMMAPSSMGLAIILVMLWFCCLY